MFDLPTVEECKKNKQHLIEKWLQVSKTFSEKKYADFLKFYQKCFVFHHFCAPEEVVNAYYNQEKIDKYLQDIEVIKSSSEQGSSVGASLDFLDTPLGLDQFVFFSFGVPKSPAGFIALIFGLPFQNLLKKYSYPQIWASWGDIFTYAVDDLGGQLPTAHNIKEPQLNRITQQYRKTIILPEDIPELAAVYTLSQCQDLEETINKKWFKFKSGYYGPEIKIYKQFPLKYVTHCFIDDHNSLAGQIAFQLYKKKIIPNEPIIDNFFHQDIYKRFYIDFLKLKNTTLSVK